MKNWKKLFEEFCQLKERLDQLAGEHYGKEFSHASGYAATAHDDAYFRDRTKTWKEVEASEQGVLGFLNSEVFPFLERFCAGRVLLPEVAIRIDAFGSFGYKRKLYQGLIEFLSHGLIGERDRYTPYAPHLLVRYTLGKSEGLTEVSTAKPSRLRVGYLRL